MNLTCSVCFGSFAAAVIMVRNLLLLCLQVVSVRTCHHIHVS